MLVVAVSPVRYVDSVPVNAVGQRSKIYAEAFLPWLWVPAVPRTASDIPVVYGSDEDKSSPSGVTGTTVAVFQQYLGSFLTCTA